MRQISATVKRPAGKTFGGAGGDDVHAGILSCADQTMRLRDFVFKRAPRPVSASPALVRRHSHDVTTTREEPNYPGRM